MDVHYATIFAEQREQFNQIKEILIKEQNELTEKCELERKALRAVETNITETVDKLDETRNEINQTEVLIELEKLKQRKCSDETQTFKEVLLREIEYETSVMQQRNKSYRDAFQVDLKLIKDTKTVVITFLNNDQVIHLNLNNQFKATFEKMSDFVIENGKTEAFVKILSKYNETSSQMTGMKELILRLRELFLQ